MPLRALASWIGTVVLAALVAVGLFFAVNTLARTGGVDLPQRHKRV
jgi:hypothetical protein